MAKGIDRTRPSHYDEKTRFRGLRQAVEFGKLYPKTAGVGFDAPDLVVPVTCRCSVCMIHRFSPDRQPGHAVTPHYATTKE